MKEKITFELINLPKNNPSFRISNKKKVKKDSLYTYHSDNKILTYTIAISSQKLESDISKLESDIHKLNYLPIHILWK